MGDQQPEMLEGRGAAARYGTPGFWGAGAGGGGCLVRHTRVLGGRGGGGGWLDTGMYTPMYRYIVYMVF